MPKTSEAEYQKVKKVLEDSGITTEDEINEKIEGMLKSARFYSAIVTVITIVLCALLSPYAIFIVLVSCVYLAWIWSSTLAGKSYFNRFLQEQKEQ